MKYMPLSLLLPDMATWLVNYAIESVITSDSDPWMGCFLTGQPWHSV